MIEAAFATNVGVLQGPNEGQAFLIRVNLHNLENMHGSWEMRGSLGDGFVQESKLRNFSTFHFCQIVLGGLFLVSS